MKGSYLKLTALAATILVTGCQSTGTAQSQLYDQYRSQPNMKAYSIGTNGIAGAAWGASSTKEAVELANKTCKDSGGINCNVTEINGVPAANYQSGALSVVTTPKLPVNEQTKLYDQYRAKPNMKAYSIGMNGISGAAWGAGTVEEAIKLANRTCKELGGMNCNVTDINGMPASDYNGTSKKAIFVKKPSGNVQLLPGAYSVKPLTFTEIENNKCKIINTYVVERTAPNSLETELANEAYMMGGNRFHITKIIDSDGQKAISVVADIYRCKHATIAY